MGAGEQAVRAPIKMSLWMLFDTFPQNLNSFSSEINSKEWTNRRCRSRKYYFWQAPRPVHCCRTLARSFFLSFFLLNLSSFSIVSLSLLQGAWVSDDWFWFSQRAAVDPNVGRWSPVKEVKIELSTDKSVSLSLLFSFSSLSLPPQSIVNDI